MAGDNKFESIYPLTPMQQGMLFHTLLHPGAGAYLVQLHWLLEGPLDARALHRAWQAVVDHHPVLRTAFAWDHKERPLQAVLARAEVPWAEQDWSGLSAAEQDQRLRGFLEEDQRRDFDLKRAPLLRLVLVRLSTERHRLLWSSHHLLLDGWSTSRVLGDVLSAYAALTRGQAPRLTPCRPFRDFVSWLGKQDPATAGSFWGERLRDYPGAVPLELPRPAQGTGTGEARRELSPELTEAVRALARSERLTENVILLGAFCVLLSRYANREGVAVGVTVSGRPPTLEGAELMVGLFINTLPVSVQVEDAAPVSAWLTRLQEQLVASQAWSATPLPELRRHAKVAANQPLFEQLFVFENYPDTGAEPPDLGGMRVGEVSAVEQPDYPLTLVAAPGARLVLRALFDARRFDRPAMERLLGHFENVLRGMVAAPGARLETLGLVGPEEARHLRGELSGERRPYPADASLVELFEAQVARAPEAPVLLHGARRLTYRELDGRAERLHHRLLAAGVRPGDRVAVLLERGADFLVAMLGILKSGAAYVPLDLAQPAERLAFMLADSGARVLLAEGTPSLERPAGCAVLDVSEARVVMPPETRPRERAGGGAVAYVMYTSGSTGRPKGIAVPHRAVSRLVLDNRFLSLEPGARVAFASNVSFDAATLELWGALLHGCCLVVLEREVLLSSEALATRLREEPVSLLWLTAGVFHQVAREAPGAFAPVDCLICGGDVVDPHAVRAVRAAGGPRRLLNGYGPTENTTFTATHDTADLGPTAVAVPIGRPISNTEVFVFDRRMRLQPVGVPGELLAGGDGLALGYHARPELTAERFVPHPFSPRPGARLYRTGDTVRWREDGTLEFLGREDQQLKLRGFRIEPGEVEAVLGRHPAVEQALVVPHDFAEGDRRLVAYVVGTGRPSPRELRAWAAQRLPDYMVPAAITVLDALPLTTNGKVDRRALPSPEAEPDAPGTHARVGESPTVQVLAGIWSQVLRVPTVQAEDSFFELGGHSLLATVVLSRLRAAFGVELPLSTLFEAPSLRALAARIDTARRGGSAAGAIEPVPRDGLLPLSFAQQRLWFLDRYTPLSAAYHIPHALHLHGALDVEALTWCLGEIVRRHEVLRTALPEVEGRPRQQVLAWKPLELPGVDLGALPESERQEQVRQHLRQQFETPFDLARGPLMRVLLLRLGPTEHVLAITLHHIVADGWSVGLFARELKLLYAARREGRQSPLPELAVQYADFATWQRRWLQGAVLERQLAYWRGQLESLPGTELTADRPRPATQSFQGAVLEVELPEALSRAVGQLARKEDSTPFMVLLAGFFALLHRYTGQEDLVVGSPVANRHPEEIEPLIGFFVNMLAMRARVEGAPSFAKLLAQVRRTALEAYDHQDVPFEMLVETLRPTRDPSRQPLFQVTFAVHNVPGEDVELPGVTLGSVRTDLDWVRFDLELHLWQHPQGGLRGYWAYATSLFDAATIERLHQHYVNLLTAAVARPERALASLPLLDAGERRRLLVEWNATAAPFPSDPSLHQRVDAWALAHPERPAVLLDGARLDYGELKRRSDGLARELVRHGVGPETRVGLLVERSLEMVVGLLAVLKAGAAYVPLDPSYPRARLEFLTREAAPTLLLSHRGLTKDLAVDCPVLDLEGLEERTREQPEGAPAVPFHPRQAAYVLFTSGSTGLPKGVEVSHQALVNHMAWMQTRFPLGAEDRVLQKTTFTFDASVWEFWAPLLAGAPVVLARPGLHADPRYLVEVLREQRITVLQMVPSVLELLVSTPGLEECRALRRVFVGGEALTWPLVRRLRERVDVEVVNLYGPAEATIDATFAVWTREAEGGPASIGRPISNMRAYVLDRHREPVPVGVPGELYLTGDGLARGYLRRPAFTAERFLPDPHATTPGARMYRTGDLARWLPDGQLEYLGRVDQQVKIRGQRVELGEVETQLQSLAGVRDAVVTLFEEEGQARLVAYVVPAESGPGEEREEERERRAEARVNQWRTFYEELYRHEAVADPTFDITGWNSSYTGAPLPAPEMRRWLDTTLERIFQLSPRRVLEVGCGTGLILFSVAPLTERYHALDFSSSVIARLRAGVAARGLTQVELEQRAAHDLGHLPASTFDTVVLNSVIQYFPSAEYLLKVLEQAVRVTAPGGAIFVGDVRSLPLLDAYHASVQWHQAGPEVGREELARRIESQRRREEELVVDPALFSALRARLPRVHGVTVRVKRGGADNELMRYRYDVVLHLDRPKPRPKAAPLRLDGQAAGSTVEAVGRLLAESRPDAVRIERLENPRVSRDLRLLAALRQPGEESLAELRAELEARPSSAADPEAWSLLGKAQGYQVEVSPSEQGGVGELDVLLLLAEALAPGEDVPVKGEEGTGDPRRWASDPLPNRWSRSLAPELRERLLERLPAYMVPQTLLCLESLPLTANGKVDRRALPRPDREGLVNRETYVRPSTETERKLAQVWRGLLELERVGVRDDFFALGGHSLLVVMLGAAIRNTLGVELAVPRLFQLTTIEAQARAIEETRRQGPGASEGIVTRLQDSGGRRVFCFPPLMGYGLAFLGLSQQVAGHDFYAFDFPENEPDPLERYAAAVDELQPEGPLVFIGYSAGGPVALEVARLLQRRGRQVSDLVLLDAAVVEERRVLSEAELDAVVADNLDYFEAFFLREPLLRERFTGTAARAAMGARMKAYARFLEGLEHRGEAVPVNVHLIQAADAGEGRRDWDELVGGRVRLHQGQGRHVDMVQEDHVAANAALMTDILSGLSRD